MQYISREGSAVINVAKYLLSTRVGDRVKTIDALSTEYGVSIGFIQKALTTIEEHEAVHLRRQGRNGTVIESLNESKLVQLAGIAHMVCAMPLPYTKHYEGLASGIKAQMNTLPVFFAHMRGANVRAECLKSGTYDIAIMSRLAANEYAEGLVTVLDLGPHSYSNPHRLIFRQGEYEQIRRVGVDFDSPDQKLLTELAFAGKDIELVEIRYSEGINLLKNKTIDAVVWLPEATDMVQLKLEEKSLDQFEECQQASEAVILVNNDSPHIRILLRKLLNIQALRQHQQAVIDGDIYPNY
ncbi:GntR family transcriptional regulator YhfZ [Vibrio diazotrophicus]|uniref:GntR family transcriptional regulator YhfZ n=1 Tax=Vibrio diazotrophicus TaxID=685 RepID=UPI003D2F6CEC